MSVIKGDAAFSAVFTETNVKGSSIKTARFGDFSGGTWFGPGNAGRLTASSIDNWVVEFAGHFSAIKSTAAINNSQLQVGSAGIIEAKSNIINSQFMFTDPFDDADPKKLAFKKFKAGQLIADTIVTSNASVGNIESRKAVNFGVYVGIDPGAVAKDALAVASSDFIYPARVGSVKIKGIKGDPVAMDNVFVNSHDFGVINISYAAHGVGPPFGFSGINFSKGISYRDNDIKVKLRLTGPDLVSIGADTRLVVSALP